MLCFAIWFPPGFDGKNEFAATVRVLFVHFVNGDGIMFILGLFGWDSFGYFSGQGQICFHVTSNGRFFLFDWAG